MNINATLFGQTIGFALFVWFCMKYVWPPVTEAMRARQKRIADGLDAADRAGHDLELAQEKAAQYLKKAKEEAAGIVDGANRRDTQIVEDARNQARDEAEKIKTAAHAEIDQAVSQAREQLRAQVAALALAGAEQILEASVDENAHKALVDKLAASL